MNKIKTITFFSAYYPPHTGGVERYVRSLALNLTARGIKVFIVTSAAGGTAGVEEDQGIAVVRLPVYDLLKSRYPIIKTGKQARNLKKYIMSIESDVYVSNMRIYHFTFLAAKTAALKKKPHIVIEHVTGHFSINNPVLDKLGHFYEHCISSSIGKKATAFYGVSEACCGWLGHFAIPCSGVFPNGVQDSGSPFGSVLRELGAGGEKVVFTYAGRLIEEKGLKLLCSVFNSLHQQNPDTVLVIAGSGELEGYVRRQAADSNGTIIYAGSLSHDDAVNLLKETSVVVNPSVYPEGLPTLLLEAGLFGCAVVATDMGGTKELICSEDYGLVIEPGNGEALFSAMSALASDGSRRQKLAENLQRRVKENYLWDTVTSRFIGELNKYI